MKKFRPMNDYPYHEINSDGFIRSVDRLLEYTHKGKTIKRFFKGRMLKRVIHKGRPSYRGYYHICIASEGVHNYLLVHRLVAEHFVRTWNPDMRISFKDGNKLNVKADNLIVTKRRHNCG
jgi:hypothetical protein